MEKVYIIKELDRIKGKLYKTLTIYEEDNSIVSKRKTPPKVNSKNVPHPLPYCEYIESVVKFIEGLLLGLQECDNEELVSKLITLKINLLSVQYHKGEDAYNEVKQKIFNGMRIIQDLIDLLGSR